MNTTDAMRKALIDDALAKVIELGTVGAMKWFAAALAAQQSQPVAEVREDKRSGKLFIATINDADLEPGTKLYDHARAETVPQWLPIESAPKDGRVRLNLWIVHENAKFAKDPIAEGWAGPVVGQWLDFNSGGWSWNGLYGTPTHWMPLPPEPTK